MPYEHRKECIAAAEKIVDDKNNYRPQTQVEDEFIDIPFTQLKTQVYPVDSQQVKLPTIIYELMEFIKGKDSKGNPNIEKENTFRLNGNLTTKDDICLHMQLKNYRYLKEEAQIDNSHEVCTLLKQVILELSEPLIPFATYEEILKKIKKIIREATEKN